MVIVNKISCTETTNLFIIFVIYLCSITEDGEHKIYEPGTDTTNMFFSFKQGLVQLVFKIDGDTTKPRVQYDDG